MEIAHILKSLWKQRIWVALGLSAAVLVSWATTFKVSFPPSAQPRSIEYGSGWTQILIDARQSPLFDIEASIDPVSARAEVYVRLVDSEPVREAIAREAGVDAGEIALSARTPSFNSTRAAREPASEQRSQQIANEAQPKRVLFAAEEDVPMISIFTQAATPADAIHLADASARGLIRYLEGLDAHRTTPRARRIEFRQLGSAQGELVNPGASKAMALMVVVVVFGLWCITVLVISNLIAALRAPSEARTCGECGAELRSDERFCPECGNELALPGASERPHPPGHTTTKQPVTDPRAA